MGDTQTPNMKLSAMLHGVVYTRVSQSLHVVVVGFSTYRSLGVQDSVVRAAVMTCIVALKFLTLDILCTLHCKSHTL